jgi:hypothetical protein
LLLALLGNSVLSGVITDRVQRTRELFSMPRRSMPTRSNRSIKVGEKKVSASAVSSQHHRRGRPDLRKRAYALLPALGRAVAGPARKPRRAWTNQAAPDVDPLGQYERIKNAIQQAFVDSGGTLSHHHAVGTEHAAWLAQDISAPGIHMIDGLLTSMDPGRNFNPGKIIAK